jgi:hypothetical protein
MSHSVGEGEPSEQDKQDVFQDLLAGSEYVLLIPLGSISFSKYLGMAHCNPIWRNQDGYAHQYTHFSTLPVFFMRVFLRKNGRIWMPMITSKWFIRWSSCIQT